MSKNNNNGGGGGGGDVSLNALMARIVDLEANGTRKQNREQTEQNIREMEERLETLRLRVGHIIHFVNASSAAAAVQEEEEEQYNHKNNHTNHNNATIGGATTDNNNANNNNANRQSQ